MKGLTDVARQLMPGDGRRPLDDEEIAVCEDVLDAAAEWHAGRLPLQVFAQIGRLPCQDSRGRRVESAGYARFVAMWHAAPGDPRRDALMAAIEHLVRQQRVIISRHGLFDHGDVPR
jgi:hypothetical protein